MIVKIVVDQLGRIECMATVQGHPLLLASVIEALKSWQFGRFEIKGKPTPVLGVLAFAFYAWGAVRLDKSIRWKPEPQVGQQ